MMSMQLDYKGLEFLKDAEGREPQAYPDTGNHLTIGYGHLLTESELISGVLNARTMHGDTYTVQWRDGLSQNEMDDVFRYDLISVEHTVNKYVRVSLQQHHYNALVSFTFNVGNTGFATSTLLRLLNQGKYSAVPAQLRRWVYETRNGVKRRVPGLVNRREKEVKMWLNRWD